MTDDVQPFFEYDPQKSEWLRHHRGLGFEEIIAYIEEGYALDVVRHADPSRYPGQWMYEVNVEGYVYVVPFMIKGKARLLKTLFPSRKATRKNLAKGNLP